MSRARTKLKDSDKCHFFDTPFIDALVGFI